MALVCQIANSSKTNDDGGTTFFVVGDYGVVEWMNYPNSVFDQINGVVGAAEEHSISDPEFFVTVGDNIYPAIADAPTVEEFELMVGLFNRSNIADLPVWNVRGNHDAYFNWTYELLLSMDQKQWQLPSFWYTKLVPSGKDGELLGLLFVDSVLMACSNYTNLAPEDIQDKEMKQVRQSICDN